MKNEEMIGSSIEYRHIGTYRERNVNWSNSSNFQRIFPIFPFFSRSSTFACKKEDDNTQNWCVSCYELHVCVCKCVCVCTYTDCMFVVCVSVWVVFFIQI